MPYNWTSKCTWRHSYIPVWVLDTLPNESHNWNTFKAQHWVKHNDGSWNTLALLSLLAGTILTQECINALANHAATALNSTRQAISLLNGEVSDKEDGTSKPYGIRHAHNYPVGYLCYYPYWMLCAHPWQLPILIMWPDPLFFWTETSHIAALGEEPLTTWWSSLGLWGHYLVMGGV